MKSKLLVIVLCFVASALLAWAQAPATPPQSAGLVNVLREEQQAIADPFRGVTVNGTVGPGLFKIASTGVSTAPVVSAAQTFIGSLGPEQREKAMFALEDPEWRRWHNAPTLPRQGIGLKDLSAQQRTIALDLLGASLSASGLKKTTDIMKLNETLGLMRNDTRFGQWEYWITIMGEPSRTEPWGWQLDGHHCVINYFVLGDQVVMTPTFMGSEPVRAETGPFTGTVVLQEEQNMGLQLFTSLRPDQRAKATLKKDKRPVESLAAAFRDNVVMDYAGIPVSDLTADQRGQLLKIIEEYVGNMKEGHAKVRMDEVRSQLDKTWFAWIGSDAADGVFYYRIQSPVILVEFDHQAATGNPDVASRNHIHSVVRTPNGNDYGKDLLRRHYVQHPHGS